MTVSTFDPVVIAGDGVIGLSIALHLTSRNVPVTLLSPALAGAASPASAGMLAPSVERTQGAAQSFGDAARDAWSRLAALIRRGGGPAFEIRRDGIVRIARNAADAEKLRASLREGDVWLPPSDAIRTLPELSPVAGAALYPGDGVVDAPAALGAMQRALSATAVTTERARLSAIETAGGRLRAVVGDGTALNARALVLACGAWTPSVHGLPRAVPIRPIRGVMVSVDRPLVSLPVYDAEGHAYLLPRGDRTVIGATSDDVGFDWSASGADRDKLLAAAARVVPAVATATSSPPWAGLRPVTPDGLPLLGLDPDVAGLVYACGHGRNGFLHAALTGEVVADLITGRAPAVDIAPFDPTRF